MNIGIDKIGFYSPQYYIEMSELAKARNTEPNKYIIGLGLERMAIPPITQDTTSMAANAAAIILDENDKKNIDLVIVATESGTDFSKSIATSVHTMLDINPYARSIEMKQACYSATAGIQLAKGHIALHPDSKALVIASDISRYGLNTGGEPTQGAGAVAILVSKDPKIMTLNNDEVYFTDDVLDFWRPSYSDVAFVDGKYSNEQYQRFFNETLKRYLEINDASLEDFAALNFHIPYSKMGKKALMSVTNEEQHPLLFKNFEDSTYYNKRVGNIYTGSLYLSLISLLEKGNLEAGSKLGLFSYGSGAVGEFFTGNLVEGYKDALVTSHEAMMNDRKQISIPEYERMFNMKLIEDGGHQILDTSKETSVFYLTEVKHNERIYNK